VGRWTGLLPAHSKADPAVDALIRIKFGGLVRARF